MSAMTEEILSRIASGVFPGTLIILLVTLGAAIQHFVPAALFYLLGISVALAALVIAAYVILFIADAAELPGELQ